MHVNAHVPTRNHLHLYTYLNWAININNFAGKNNKQTHGLFSNTIFKNKKTRNIHLVGADAALQLSSLDQTHTAFF